MADMEDLKARVDAILSGPRKGSVPTTQAAAPTQRRPFSEFILQDVQRSREISEHLKQIADAKGGIDGLADAVSEAERLHPTERPGLVQHATKLFVTHHPLARQTFALKPLEKRQPGLVTPSASAGQNAVAGAETPTTSPTEDESKVAYWREDPLINEHHEHWHLVYPTDNPLGDRHGELFGYMHEQMLARYDAERLSAGLDRVQPFSDYTQPFVGYDPGLLQLWTGSGWQQFRARPDGRKWSNLPDGGPDGVGFGGKISEQTGIHTLLLQAITGGAYVYANGKPIPDANGKPQPVTIDNLGDTEESNSGSADAPHQFSTLGNHHGTGHVHFAYFDDKLSDAPGVMITTATAVRDPVFWEWHKHVDSIFQAFQTKLTPYDFSDAPQVMLRKTAGTPAVSTDIILCQTAALPAQFDGPTLGQQAFGYSDDPTQNRWNMDFSAGTVTLPDGTQITTSSELTTASGSRPIALEDAQGNPTNTSINCLSHDDFCYFLRVQNLQNQPQNVTVRIFLAPETLVDDKTSWIEMDRFSYSLPALARVVIYRASDASSVVRMPALKWNGLLPSDEPSQAAELPPYDWCDCGWPYTLLLPRGTTAGMAFRLFVMLSPGADLNVPPAPGPCDSQNPGNCTSISYCGLKGAPYPDSRDMGYPFNRPFSTSISNAVAQQNNMAWRTITIRYKGDILPTPGTTQAVVAGATPAPAMSPAAT